MNRNRLKSQKGVTLVVLITILIVLTILAGVTINSIIRTDGVYQEAGELKGNQSTISSSMESKISQILLNKGTTDNQSLSN